MEILTAISTFLKPIVLAGIGYFVNGAFEGHKRDNERRKKAGEERFNHIQNNGRSLIVGLT